MYACKYSQIVSICACLPYMCFMCRRHGAKSRARFLELFVKAMRESKNDHVSSSCCQGVWEEL